MTGRRRVFLFVLLAAAVVPYFVNLGATSIVDANEAFYAETPREMIESGDYISPTFNYEPRLNKPPLSYWVVAAFYRVAGVSLGASRLPIALGAIVLFATAFLLGRQAFSTRAGLIAALTLAATPRMLLFSRRIIIDVYTAMFLGLTLLCFLMAETRPGSRRRWLAAMYVAVGLGVLTKGPVAVAIPALVFLVYLVATGQLRSLGRMMLPAGALIVGAIVVPYYAALYARGGWDAIASFLLQENLARYTDGVGAPDRGLLFYLPVVFADLYLPWSLLLPAALALAPWRGIARGRAAEPASADPAAFTGRARLLLGLWIAVIVVFFSLSNGQQDLYVLPFVVAAAALVGGLLDGWLAGAWGRRFDRVVTGSVAVAAVAFVLIRGGRGVAGRGPGGPARPGRHDSRRGYAGRRGPRGSCRAGAAIAPRGAGGACRQSRCGTVDSRDVDAAGLRALQARAAPRDGGRAAAGPPIGRGHVQDCGAEPRGPSAPPRGRDVRRGATRGVPGRTSGRRLGDAGRGVRGRPHAVAGGHALSPAPSASMRDWVSCCRASPCPGSCS